MWGALPREQGALPSPVVPLHLGMARVGKPEGSLWTIFGLGSCVGVILFDPETRLSAMAHIVLPQGPFSPEMPGRYADSGLTFLVRSLLDLGAKTSSLRAVMAGGAQLSGLEGLSDIGPRNAEAVRRFLTALGIPIVAEDTGGGVARTLRWDPKKGEAYVRRAGGAEERLWPKGD